jgi:L-asparagine transporter-like permease
VEKSETEKTKQRYPHSTRRIYWSAIITVLSVLLAFLLLHDAFWLLLYLSNSFVFTAALYVVKTRILRMEDEPSNDSDETKPARSYWKSMLLTLLVLLAIAAIPLLLAGFLPPYLWFTLLISFTSGTSISEIMLYLRMR